LFSVIYYVNDNYKLVKLLENKINSHFTLNNDKVYLMLYTNPLLTVQMYRHCTPLTEKANCAHI